MKKHDAIFIGRFQPFHAGHLSVVKQALLNPNVENLRILVGSANKCRNVKNPLDYQTRARIIMESIKESIGAAPLSRIQIYPLDDYIYQPQKWIADVQALTLPTYTSPMAKFIYGYEKDASSYYLKCFPELEYIAVDPYYYNGKILNATDLREAIFTEKCFPENIVSKAANHIISNFKETTDFSDLMEEYALFQKEKQLFANYPYPHALNCCTADNVVVCQGHVLLITRKFAPGKNLWALPGGHKESTETFLECAIRELREETRLKVSKKVLLGSIAGKEIFDHPERSQNICKPTLAVYYDIAPDNDGSLPRIYGNDDAKMALWVPLDTIRRNQTRLFDDHFEIISFFTKI